MAGDVNFKETALRQYYLNSSFYGIFGLDFTMLKNITASVKNFASANPTAMRYAMDGFLAAAAINIVINNNGLYAIRLGAGDYQLSLLQLMPQALNLLILIPGGLLAGSLFNKRRMITGSLVAGAVCCLFCAFSPFVPVHSIYFFLVFLSLVMGAIAWYNISWQSYFPDVIDTDSRNRVLTLRMRTDVFVGMLIPLLVGSVLARIGTNGGKIAAHQGFYAGSALLLLMTALNYRRIEAVRQAVPKRISFAEIKKAGQSLLRNKPFKLFAGAAIFFYMTWHMDWTLYFIGQVSYLHMNEFQIGLVMTGSTVMQFLTLRFWSRRNEKHGVVLPLTFGILGLSLCPVSMIIATSMPAAIGPGAFIIFHTVVHMAFVTVILNMYQCLLLVVDEEYRSFSISVFASLVCVSNAVMPVAGVALYRALGGDLNGLRLTFLIVFSLRIVAAGLWLLRWRVSKHTSC